MSSTATSDAIAKLQSLSDERASKVVSLIEDLAELESLEDAEDLRDALEALKKLESNEATHRNSSAEGTPSAGGAQFINEDESATVSWEKLKSELNL